MISSRKNYQLLARKLRACASSAHRSGLRPAILEDEPIPYAIQVCRTVLIQISALPRFDASPYLEEKILTPGRQCLRVGARS